MPKVEITGTKGLVQSTGSTMPLTLDSTNSVIKVAIIKNSTPFIRNDDSIVEWTQPANTYILGIDLLCTTVAGGTGTGNSLGFEVGTTSSGQDIVALANDEIIDVGTDGSDLAAGGLVRCTMVRVTTDDVTLAADASYSASARTLYFNTVESSNAAAITDGGVISWIVRYVSFA